MLRKDNCKPRQETFEFWDLVRLIWEVLWYYSEVDCGAPEAVNYAVMTSSGTKLNDTATYECLGTRRMEDGHSVMTVVCGADRTWGGHKLSCEGKCTGIDPLKPRQNSLRLADEIFKRIFLNYDIAIANFHWICYQWQYSITGLDNGLSQKRRQVVI